MANEQSDKNRLADELEQAAQASAPISPTLVMRAADALRTFPSHALQINAAAQEPSGKSLGTVGSSDGYEQKASRGAPVRDVPVAAAPSTTACSDEALLLAAELRGLADMRDGPLNVGGRIKLRRAADLLCMPSATLEKPHALQASETDKHLLGAWTGFEASYPQFYNATMVRMKGDVILSIRLHGGAFSTVRFTRPMWNEFAKEFEAMNRIYQACDSLDAIL